MNTQEWADLLNGREYGLELSGEEQVKAFTDRVVIIFGASDDLMEIRGIVNDELGSFEGGYAHFDEMGLIVNECDDENCAYWQKVCDKAKVVEAIWDSEGYSWIYKTDIPHKTFDILEGGEKYCRGIVFSLDDVGQ